MDTPQINLVCVKCGSNTDCKFINIKNDEIYSIYCKDCYKNRDIVINIDNEEEIKDKKEEEIINKDIVDISIKKIVCPRWCFPNCFKKSKDCIKSTKKKTVDCIKSTKKKIFKTSKSNKRKIGHNV